MAALSAVWNGGNLRLIFLITVTGIAAALVAVATTPEEEAVFASFGTEQEFEEKTSYPEPRRRLRRVR